MIYIKKIVLENAKSRIESTLYHCQLNQQYEVTLALSQVLLDYNINYSNFLKKD